MKPDIPSAEIIQALAVLNSFARCHDLMTPRLQRSIYFYKLRLLERLAVEGQLALRPIRVQVKCSSCGGTGWYTETRRCYHCTKGIAELDFVESTCQNGLVFHSPAHQAGKLYRLVNWEETVYVQGSEWKPNQPGTERTPGEVAAALNAVESWFYGELFPRIYEIRRQRQVGYPDEYEWECDSDYFYYKLYLGSFRSGTCRYCGEIVKDASCRSTPLVWWLDSRCGACQAIHAFAPNLPPDELVSAPDVRAWLARRAGWKMAEPLAQTLNAW